MPDLIVPCVEGCGICAEYAYVFADVDPDTIPAPSTDAGPQQRGPQQEGTPA